MPKYYTEILIIGPEIKIYPEILKIYRSSSRLIIGDGINYVSTEKLKSLKELVGPSTRIDIIGHGRVTPASVHQIELFADVRDTKKTIQKIGNINDFPKYIHLWSCFCGAANEAVSFLTSGSTFITHSPADDIIYNLLAYDAIIKSIIKRALRQSDNISLSYLEDFVCDLSCNILQTASINQIENTIVTHHTIRNPEIIFTTINEQHAYFKHTMQEIGTKFKLELTISLTDQEIQEYIEKIILIETMNNRIEKKLTMHSAISQKKFIDLIAQINYKGFSLLEHAAKFSLLEVFKILDIDKTKDLDVALLRAIKFNNKDIANYIIKNSRFSLLAFEKIICKYGKKELINEFLEEAKTNQDYWKISIILECKINLGKKLNNLTASEKVMILEETAKNNYIYAYTSTLKSLLHNNKISRTIVDNCISLLEPTELLRAINEMFYANLSRARSNVKINSLLESYKKFEHQLNLDFKINFDAIKQQNKIKVSFQQTIKDYCSNFFNKIKFKINTTRTNLAKYLNEISNEFKKLLFFKLSKSQKLTALSIRNKSKLISNNKTGVKLSRLPSDYRRKITMGRLLSKKHIKKGN